MKRRRGLAPLLLWAALLASTAALGAMPPPQPSPQPQGEPRSGSSVHDRDFGVASSEFGLDRRVEMYQWRATDNGYRRVWNAAPIDSSGFAPGYANPPKLPIGSARWWSAEATLDGAPLDRSVLQALGQWRRFRPNFSRLPANLAATFQPEGDGLGSAENPLDPQIGDLRVDWRELVLPPLAGAVELRDGRWQLASATAARAAPSRATRAVAKPPPHVPPRWRGWLAGAVVVLGVLLGAVLVRQRRRTGR